jgi:hypothetical protein
VACIPIARQRLGKHIPAQANARKNGTFIARQRISKHASLTPEAVFSVGSVQRGYKEMFGSTEQYREVVEDRRVEFGDASLRGGEELNWVESSELVVVE